MRFFDRPMPVEDVTDHAIALRDAYLCHKCNRIFERSPHGVCKLCGSKNIVSVSRTLFDAAQSIAQLMAELDEARGVQPQRSQAFMDFVYLTSPKK